MVKRRGSGEGTIYQRAKDGRWVVQLSLGERRITRYAKTQADAVKLLQELRGEQVLGDLKPPSELTLEDWAQQWLGLMEAKVRPSTLRHYGDGVRLVCRHIGRTRLDRVTPLLLEQTFAQLHRDGTGARSRSLAYGYLRACLERAVTLNLIGSNPMRGVTRPGWEPRKRTYWSVEHVSRVAAVGLSAHRARWFPLLVFLSTTGLRMSEALGLTWADVDLDGRCVRVERALVWVKQRYSILPPKTEAGHREVSLPALAVEALKRQGEGAPDAYIFRNRNGNPPNPNALRSSLVRLCRIAEVPEINVHGLRHVAAMLAKEAGADMYLIQQRLGHADVSVTIRIYGYNPHDESGIGGAIDDLLKP